MQSSAPYRSWFASSHRLELVAVFGAVLVGIGVAVVPLYCLAAVGSGLLIFLLSRGPLMRAAVVIVGGLTIFQISSGLTVEKFVYLGVLVMTTLFAALSIASHWAAARDLGVSPMLLASGGVAAIVAISLLVASHSGFTIQAWALDIPAYGMLVVSIILGVDLAISDQSPRNVAALLILAGVITAAGYAIFWVGIRGISQFDTSRIVAVTLFLPAAAFCIALAYLFDGRHSYWMALLATLLVLATLLSGTRILILLVVPVIVTVGVARGRRLRVLALIVGAGFALALLASLVTLTGSLQSLNLGVLQARLTGIIPLLTSQDPAIDPSLYLRILQTRVLQEVWFQSPLFGAGPGGLYSYSNIVNDRPVDSPLAILARFGIVGAATFVVLFTVLLTSRLRREAHWVPATAILAFVSLIAAWSLVSSPLDDKGIALGLIPLIGLCGVWRNKADYVPISSTRMHKER